jgi:uncharacterized surface protein with fasciclin (FAS1) repeats
MEMRMTLPTWIKTGSFALALFAASSLTSISSKAADIVDTAVSAGSFTTLVTALKAADLVTTLKGKGPFTVFAPTDEAFKKLPAGQLDDLLKPANKEKLKKILTYHVVAKKVMAADLKGKMMEEKTVEGGMLKIDAKGMEVKVGDGMVTTADVAADNGVIHIIDTVLIPK